MDKRWERPLIVGVFVLFLAACLGIFITNMPPSEGYRVLAERQYVEPSDEKLSVDINSATVEELMDIPGIGRTLAQAVVDYREQNGAFETAADIVKVKGIGKGIYENISEYIRAEEARP